MINKRKNVAKNEKTIRNNTNKGHCEIWEAFKKYNSDFIVNSQNPFINLNRYVKKNTFLKLFILPSDYLYYWHEMINRNELDYIELGKYIISQLDKLRPICLEGFQIGYIIDQERFSINSNELYIYS